MRSIMVSQDAEVKKETKSETVVRLMKAGGYLLIAGGSTDDLPDKIRSHPQIKLWDDNKQDFLHKSVPTNTRAILTNKWISHQNMGRLRFAAERLRIPIFPMLTTREIKELLDEFIHFEPVPTQSAGELELPEPEPVPTTPAILMKEDLMRAPKQGEIQEIIKKHGLTEGISNKANAERLLPFVREANIKQTIAALEQKIAVMKRGGYKGARTATVKKMSEPEPTAKLSASDDFTEAERLLREARTAIDLFLDFLPKVRKEVVELRKKQAKLKELLG